MIVTDELIGRARYSASHGDPAERAAARAWLRAANKHLTAQRVFRAARSSEATVRRD
jgi:hypothetical protein